MEVSSFTHSWPRSRLRNVDESSIDDLAVAPDAFEMVVAFRALSGGPKLAIAAQALHDPLPVGRLRSSMCFTEVIERSTGKVPCALVVGETVSRDITGVVENKKIRFPSRCAEPPSEHLQMQNQAHCRASDRKTADLGNVEPISEQVGVGEDIDVALTKASDRLASLGLRHPPLDVQGFDAVLLELVGNRSAVSYPVTEHDGRPVPRMLDPVADNITDKFRSSIEFVD